MSKGGAAVSLLITIITLGCSLALTMGQAQLQATYGSDITSKPTPTFRLSWPECHCAAGMTSPWHVCSVSLPPSLSMAPSHQQTKARIVRARFPPTRVSFQPGHSSAVPCPDRRPPPRLCISLLSVFSLSHLSVMAPPLRPHRSPAPPAWLRRPPEMAFSHRLLEHSTPLPQAPHVVCPSLHHMQGDTGPFLTADALSVHRCTHHPRAPSSCHKPSVFVFNCTVNK